MIEDLTTTQKRMIALAERSEGYIKQQSQQRARSNGSVSTKSGVEHRQSKQRRINAAKQKHAHAE